MAFLIEKYRGNFPTWLTPVQVKVLPIAERHLEYAKKISEVLAKAKIRVEVDDKNDTLGAKIRNAQSEKVAYMFIVGDKEKDSNSVSVRKRDGEDLGSKDIEEFTKALSKEILEKATG